VPRPMDCWVPNLWRTDRVVMQLQTVLPIVPFTPVEQHLAEKRRVTAGLVSGEVPAFSIYGTADRMTDWFFRVDMGAG